MIWDFGVLLRRVRGALGCCGGPGKRFGRSWSSLGVFWRRLGAVLGISRGGVGVQLPLEPNFFKIFVIFGTFFGGHF